MIAAAFQYMAHGWVYGLTIAGALHYFVFGVWFLVHKIEEAFKSQ